MEYAPGTKITSTAAITAAGLDAPAIARRATEAYLLQILRHGFFHAGPPAPLPARLLPCWLLRCWCAAAFWPAALRSASGKHG